MTAEQVKLRSNLKKRNGYWYVGLSWYDESKKRKQTNISTGYKIEGNKRRAEIRAKEIEKDFERKLLSETMEADKILFTDWLLRWLEYTRDKVDETTFYGYEIVVKKDVIPYFKPFRLTLAEINRRKLEDFYKAAQTEKKRTASTIKHFHANIHSALKWAVIEGVLPYNPADNLRLPKVEKNEANFFTQEQVNRFLATIEGTEMEAPIKIAIWFGLRRGEIAGLQWDGIDLEGKKLRVKGTVKDKGKDKCKMYYKPFTKTKASMRSFPLTDKQVAFFTELKKSQEIWKEEPGYNDKWNGFVCVRKNGNLISLSSMTNSVPTLTVASGLPRLKLHELRHTNISLLIDNGATMIEVSKWAGHSRPSTTSDIYAHIDKRGKEKCAGILESLFT